MKALTIRQPWASLIAMGVKTIETRSWSTRYRGPLAIHAGLALPNRAVAPDAWAAIPEGPPVPFGAVVATARLVDVVPMRSTANRGGCLPDGLILDMPDDGCLPHQSGGMWLIGSNGLTRGKPTHVEDQRPYGDFAPGRYAWLLADITPCDPIPAKGKQGLWEWTE